MEVVLLLANSAEPTPVGTVSALGLGWSVTSTPTGPSAVVVFIKVPWDLTNRKHRMHLQLVDSDGKDVYFGKTPEGEDAPVEVRAEFEVGRPPGLLHGTEIDQAFPINIAPGLELTAGQIYQWRVRIDDVDMASRSFYVRPTI